MEVPPGTDELRSLVRRWRENDDRAARDELIHRMLPLAHAMARRYAGRGEPLDDLEQVASVGLLKAVDRFDLDRGVRFTTFAVPTIAGELKRHFRDRGWMMRVPREVQDLAARLSPVRDRLTTDLGRSPTINELSEALGASLELTVEALTAGHAYRTLSFDEPTGDGAAVLDVVGENDVGFDRAEVRLDLREGLEHLPPREREILRLRFAEDLTQREIAAAIGISQMHVSRLLRRSVVALREHLDTKAA
jgi:RNA polymerase sigma-B factor